MATRKESSIYNLRLFHNWVKKELIFNSVNLLNKNYDVPNDKIYLMDLACGKGGDINKYNDAKISKVIGFDIDPKSINGENGAKQRFNELKKRSKKYLEYKFFVMDLSDQNNISKIQHIIPGQKFSIFTCQFAIHYFFKDPTSLNTLINIIKIHLDTNKHRSIFIGTTMNGDKLKDILLKKNISNSIFEINKDLQNDYSQIYGNKYTVSLGKETDTEHYFVNKPSEEYLVNLEELKKVCEKNDLIFIGTIDFERWYQLYLDSNPKYKLSDEEKEFSFLNFSFIFMSKLSK